MIKKYRYKMPWLVVWDMPFRANAHGFNWKEGHGGFPLLTDHTVVYKKIKI